MRWKGGEGRGELGTNTAKLQHAPVPWLCSSEPLSCTVSELTQVAIMAFSKDFHGHWHPVCPAGVLPGLSLAFVTQKSLFCLRVEREVCDLELFWLVCHRR